MTSTVRLKYAAEFFSTEAEQITAMMDKNMCEELQVWNVVKR